MNRLFYQPHQAGLTKVEAAADTLRYKYRKHVTIFVDMNLCVDLDLSIRM